MSLVRSGSLSVPFRVMLATPMFGVQGGVPSGIEHARDKLARSLTRQGASVVALVPPGLVCVPYTHNLLCLVEHAGIRYERFGTPAGFVSMAFARSSGEPCDVAGVYAPKGDQTLARHDVVALKTFADCVLDVPRLFGLKPDVILIDGAAMALIPAMLVSRMQEDFLLEGVKTVFLLDGSEERPAPFVRPQDLEAAGLQPHAIDAFKAGSQHSLVLGALRSADYRTFYDAALNGEFTRSEKGVETVGMLAHIEKLLDNG